MYEKIRELHDGFPVLRDFLAAGVLAGKWDCVDADKVRQSCAQVNGDERRVCVRV